MQFQAMKPAVPILANFMLLAALGSQSFQFTEKDFQSVQIHSDV